MAASAGAAGVASRPDRLAVLAERLLRQLADARVGLGLLLLTGLANLVAALLPEGPRRLDGLPYALLLAALALSAVAAVAVRAPATFAGALLLSASLAIGFWLPRRRVTVRPAGTAMAVNLRGERIDHPTAGLDQLVALLGARR